jgi:hypothetical protein
VEAGTVTVAVILTGEFEVGLTLAPGVKWHTASAIVVLHETVTA